MNILAIIFDIYGTLLEVGPSPPDADARWEMLWHNLLAVPPRLTLAHFSAVCDSIVTREHAAAHTRGIPYPEVSWLYIVCQAMPELRLLAPDTRQDFLFQQSQLWHTVRLSPEAAETLRLLRSTSVLLGLASNAQAYTLRELQEALANHGLGMDLFQRDLCFWSFEHGFSKPDPHVFQILTARFRARGVHSQEILMVGDRLDNDIEPAKAHGWQTWQLGQQADGDWASLRRHLTEHQPKAF